LRHAQQELRTVIATNKARKKRLIAIARDRLGYQEYLDVRDSVDKNIVSLYTKLQKKDLPKVSKKKKQKLEGAAPVNASGKEGSGVVVPLPNPAALGLGPDETNALVVNDALKRLVDTRKQWVNVVGEVFEEKERENPGRIWGIPQKSVYEGLEEDVQRELEQPIAEIKVSDPSKRISKGKQRAIGDVDRIPP
jgi:transcriptional adapter 3